jgi:hypothetical protein
MRNDKSFQIQTSGVSSVPQSEISKANRYQTNGTCRFKNGGAIRLNLLYKSDKERTGITKVSSTTLLCLLCLARKELKNDLSWNF